MRNEKGQFVVGHTFNVGKKQSVECKAKRLKTFKKNIAIHKTTRYWLGKKRINTWNKGKRKPTTNDSYPLEFRNQTLRKMIKHRDWYKCQNCGILDNEHRRKFKRGLHLHHIDYNKMNSKFENLVLVCAKCNSLANFNRWFWLEFYSFFIPKVIGRASKYMEIKPLVYR